MAEEQDKIELTPKQKTMLLNLGLETATANAAREESRGDLLYDVLKHPLPMEASTVSMLPAPLRGLSRRISSLAGGPLLEQITSPSTEISAIERIKKHAKHSGRLAKSKEQTDVLLAIYYAPIASGLVFHTRRITEHSYDHLAEAFGALASKDWMAGDLAELFGQARRYCQERPGEANSL